MRKSIFLTIAIVVITSALASATIINVPGDSSTIQAGIDGCSNGDTVLVQPNTYYENINFIGKNITLASLYLTTSDTSYISSTIIDGSDSDIVVRITGGEDTTAVLIGFTIQNGYIYAEPRKGGGIRIVGSSPVITNNIIRWNWSRDDGGGIYCEANASPIITYNNIYEDTSGNNGSGISAYNSSPSIIANIIHDNYSPGGNGGGVEVKYCVSSIIKENLIFNNYANQVGGGILCSNSSLTIENNTIVNNSTMDGGGIYCSFSDPIIYGNEIDSNTANNGGGIYCNFSHAVIDSNTINNNSAQDGGGIYCWDNSSPTISRNLIDNNNTTWSGGGIFCLSSNPDIINNTISNNTADSGYTGGGIYLDSSSPTISGNTISGNAADLCAGGIMCTNYSHADIDSNIIIDNTAEDGGGIYCDNSNPTITNNTVTENSANNNGGGICCWDGSSPIVSNNTISINHAYDLGGGIYFDYSNPTMAMENNTIIYNTASSSGGGIYCYHSSPTIQNNTFSGNYANNDGGGIHCDNSSPTILNTILWDDSASIGGNEIHLWGVSDPTVTYSDVEGGYPGEGNIDSLPLFANPDSGDFHLTWASYPITDSTKSPCIDAGDPDISYNDPDGTRNDMGAYFFPQFRCLTCDAETSTPEVPNEEGTISWNLTVTNCSSQNTDVRGEIYPTVGDCASGTQYDYNLTRLITTNLEAGQSYTGRYWYRPILVTGIDLAAITTEVGPAVNDYIASCCFEFFFSYEWGRPNADPYFGSGEWGEWTGDVVIPGMTALNQNYPNPFNASTTISFDIVKSGDVNLSVYNLMGQKIETLIDRNMPAGHHNIIWDASTYSSGVYFYKLTTKGKTFTKRMTLLK